MGSGEVGSRLSEVGIKKTTNAPTTNYQQFIFHPTLREAEALNPSLVPQIQGVCS